jgi:hypothetical protein
VVALLLQQTGASERGWAARLDFDTEVFSLEYSCYSGFGTVQTGI